MKKIKSIRRGRALVTTGGQKASGDGKEMVKLAKSFAAMIEDKAHQMGLPLKVDAEYSIPFVNRKFVLWIKFTEKDGTIKWVPYVEHKGMVDVLMQKGYESLDCQMLEPLKCIEAGCYNAGPNDYMQRSACTIHLRAPKKGVPGRWARLEADACKHNTTSMISGTGTKRASAMRRMAETRAMDRVISRLCNVGAVSLMELPEIEKDVVGRKGDRLMSAGEINTIIEGDFTVAESQTVPASSEPQSERAREEARQDAAEGPQHTPEWLTLNRKLHKLLSDHGIGGQLLVPMHGWICRVVAKVYKHPIADTGKLTDAEIAYVVEYLETSTGPDQWATILAWCKAQVQGGA